MTRSIPCVQLLTLILPVVLVGLSMLLATAASAADPDDLSQWYPFEPKDVTGPSVIGMEDWLVKPAGSRGPVRMVGDRFELADGSPIKFWGVNLGNLDCAPEKELGRRWVKMHAKYGVNCVRLHKFYPDITVDASSTRFDPELVDRFDSFAAEAKKHGMYYGFSWLFGHNVRPEDRAKLLAYDEIKAAGGSTSRVLVFIAEDVQDLRIEMLTNLLKRRNQYTGMTYARDPALAFVELHNEDSIFFYTFRGFAELDKMPTYKKKFNERFSGWLKRKYRSHAGLIRAWGEGAMNAFEIKDEHLDKGNIMVQPNPWHFGPEGLKQAEGSGLKRRLLDTAEFLYHVQTRFYERFAKAIRDAGYDGPLVGSCWKTPAGVPQYYNLHSDYQIGLIDRHNYFGGQGGWRPQTGKFNAGSQLGAPGTGLISQGMMQVVDRPFALSEWNTVFPNQWAPESLTIIAAYGLGLQGWDASYHFASHVGETQGGFSKRLDGPRLWALDVPNQIGLYPALARMIYRGDVTESKPIAVRRVSLKELRDGKPDWINAESATVSAGLGDFSEITGAVPPATLAAGRAVVEFTDDARKSDLPDLNRHVEGNTVRSVTDQLHWTVLPNGRGFITINTPGTQAAVGFMAGRSVETGPAKFESSNEFAAIYVSSLATDRGIDSADQVLVTAMARVRNTGMKFNDAGDELLALGRAPMLLEPVEASITFRGRTVVSIEPLDHDGRATGKQIKPDGNTLRIDGRTHRTPYYLVRLR